MHKYLKINLLFFKFKILKHISIIKRDGIKRDDNMTFF